MLKINNSLLTQILKNHLDNKTVVLTDGLKKSLDSPIFSWGSITHRKNGETVTDPRNAIDTGELQKSVRLETGRGLSNKIIFDAEYAEKVIDHASVDFVDFTIERLNDR